MIPLDAMLMTHPAKALRFWKDTFPESWPGLGPAYHVWRGAKFLRDLQK